MNQIDEKDDTFESEATLQARKKVFSRMQAQEETETDLILEGMNIFSKKDTIGGEGTTFIQAARREGGGYWFLTVLAIQGRGMALGPQLCYLAYCTLLVVFLQTQYRALITESWTAASFSGIQLMVTLITSGLFFLQTFRTNSAYQRWWEGRTLLGNIEAHTQCFIRHILCAIDDEEEPPGENKSFNSRVCQKLARSTLHWTAAFLIVLKNTLRDDFNMGEALTNVPGYLRWLYCLQQIHKSWADATGKLFMTKPAVAELCKGMMSVLTIIQTCVASINRIKETPMPFAYVVHLRTFLMIWLGALPFIFIVPLGYGAVAVTSIIAYSLLGMEALCLEIENPFGRDFNDLPIDLMFNNLIVSLMWCYSQTSDVPDEDVSASGCNNDKEVGEVDDRSSAAAIEWTMSRKIVQSLNFSTIGRASMNRSKFSGSNSDILADLPGQEAQGRGNSEESSDSSAKKWNLFQGAASAVNKLSRMGSMETRGKIWDRSSKTDAFGGGQAQLSQAVGTNRNRVKPMKTSEYADERRGNQTAAAPQSDEMNRANTSQQLCGLTGDNAV
ncbi:hypothetical protein CEUSTIGMA_g6219.t1 [Chlamydomonas eustigma]|uniref:Bestrophin homolog n=1 Tax=Chlamydomonas eustigma TaxID=1157962 RepID=A0A250X7B7_9CHLO|nr:hypothetical protein CEUSTIGMA_g6219.t1 [Chlamydomonas eustigma]|eukprot:GAX78782.1 hypothetical protein CEUSTIGMA_g6219.t1 [Chlamydomonas eustigma]